MATVDSAAVHTDCVLIYLDCLVCIADTCESFGFKIVQNKRSIFSSGDFAVFRFGAQGAVLQGHAAIGRPLQDE